jgi:hypothetical protein
MLITDIVKVQLPREENIETMELDLEEVGSICKLLFYSKLFIINFTIHLADTKALGK